MGSGKTSVGLQLAKLVHKPFYDSDTEIEHRTGASVSWIFELENEEGFRKREAKAIKDLTHLNGIILATGGGCILNANTREYLKSNGIVVYLKVTLPEQIKRASHRHGTRPLLNVPNPAEKLTQLNTEREPLYLEIADLKYDTDTKTPKEIALQILHDINVDFHKKYEHANH